MNNGIPQPTLGAALSDSGFFSGRTGSYSIEADCTGTDVVNVPGGVVLDHAIVWPTSANRFLEWSDANMFPHCRQQ